jgi:hypothetical protein
VGAGEKFPKKRKKLGGGWGENKVPKKIEIKGEKLGRGWGENKVAKRN